MGLTGLITEATIQMLPVETSYMLVDTERAADLDDVMGRMRTGDAAYRLHGGLVDCLAPGAGWAGRSSPRRPCRAWRTCPRRADRARVPARRPARRAAGPAARADQPVLGGGWPTRLCYRRAPRSRHGELQTIGALLPPAGRDQELEPGLRPGGFLQYQFVVPFGQEAAVRRSSSGQPGPRRLLPDRAQAVRRGRPRAALVPGARLDARARPARPHRRLTACWTRSTGSSSTPAAGSTWPRTPGCPAGTLAEMYPRLDEFRSCGPGSTRTGCSPPTWPAGFGCGSVPGPRFDPYIPGKIGVSARPQFVPSMQLRETTVTY